MVPHTLLLPYRGPMASRQPYCPDPKILELGPDFYDAVEPARFPKAVPRFLNQRWAERIGLGQVDWEAHFHRFEPLPGNLTEPLALRYHGHQFRTYNPEIGDGRGFLFAQLRESPGWRAQPNQPGRADGRLLDLGTKGSGQTPYSRFGDGRLTLKGGVREVLATEMLEALGVNTSKTFALFETGEELVRGDEPSPTRSSVLTRLSHGHIRIGTFQRLAYFEQTGNIARLVRYCLEHLYGEPADAGPHRLFELVAAKTAGLAASYMAAGFVHGVLNSDNIAITAESFDYGPWRFTQFWDDGFTAAYFDETGLYAFGRQPESIHWNLAQLAGCLALVAEAPPLADQLHAWPAQFEEALIGCLLNRFGVSPLGAAEDRPLAATLVAALQSRAVTIDRLFFDWRGGRDPGADAYPDEPFRELAKRLEGRAQPTARTHPYWSDAEPCSMHIEEVESIWSAIAQSDDWAPFEAKLVAIRRMAEAMRAA